MGYLACSVSACRNLLPNKAKAQLYPHEVASMQNRTAKQINYLLFFPYKNKQTIIQTQAS